MPIYLAERKAIQINLHFFDENNLTRTSLTKKKLCTRQKIDKKKAICNKTAVLLTILNS